MGGYFWCISLQLLYCLEHSNFVQLQKALHSLQIFIRASHVAEVTVGDAAGMG